MYNKSIFSFEAEKLNKPEGEVIIDKDGTFCYPKIIKPEELDDIVSKSRTLMNAQMKRFEKSLESIKECLYECRKASSLDYITYEYFKASISDIAKKRGVNVKLPSISQEKFSTDIERRVATQLMIESVNEVQSHF